MKNLYDTTNAKLLANSKKKLKRNQVHEKNSLNNSSSLNTNIEVLLKKSKRNILSPLNISFDKESSAESDNENVINIL